jgi:ankyrin repeat protein
MLFNAVLNGEHEKIRQLISDGADPNYTKFICHTRYLRRWVNSATGEWHTGICTIVHDHFDQNGRAYLEKKNVDDNNEETLNYGYVYLNKNIIDENEDIIDVISNIDENGIGIKLIIANQDYDADNNDGIWKHYQFRLSQNTDHIKYKREIVDANYMTMLMLAAFCGHNECLVNLIRCGASINSKNDYDDTPLIYAIENGNVECAKTLLLASAEINICNIWGTSPLAFAVRNRMIDIVEYILKSGFNPNQKICGEIRTMPAIFYTTRLLAPEDMNINIFDMLLKYGADPNIIDDETNQHILYKVICKYADGYKYVFDKLISKISNIEHQNKYDKTLLVHAIEAGSRDTAYYVEQIIAHGASLTTKSNNETPFIIAMKNLFVHDSVVECLLKSGADPNMESNEKKTPLLIAIHKKSKILVDLLLKFGANPNLKSSDGLSPLILATRKQGLDDIVGLLVKAGAV